MTDNKPEPGAWLPQSHFGFFGDPLPSLTEDKEPDPDEKNWQ